ncbi:hypothetical protein EYV94_26035 [Puteibacter caeruleilacunae]|nr:hypothetical protein EYV94_26035 [Puteibacter caeruleilacunae]
MIDTIQTIPTTEVFRIALNTKKPAILIETDWYILGGTAVLFIVCLILKKKFGLFFKWYEMEFEISGSPKATFKVKRNTENLYIANRIYIELTTRKAAMLIDENNDVIEEIYNSWYSLFGIIRDEIKQLPGEYLKDHDPSKALLGLTSKILNEGLRPHLTKYQAKYRKWLEQEKEKDENKNKSPQEVQRTYPEYQALVSSMKDVNRVLIKYSEDLNKLIKG